MPPSPSPSGGRASSGEVSTGNPLILHRCSAVHFTKNSNGISAIHRIANPLSSAGKRRRRAVLPETTFVSKVPLTN